MELVKAISRGMQYLGRGDKFTEDFVRRNAGANAASRNG
jgi:hypothetical protein